jgi:large subunit ribosomal protein L5
VSLVTTYRQKVLPEVQKKLGVKNLLAAPRILKVVINIGIGSYTQRKDKDYNPLVERVAAISCQKPLVTLASKAISNFKLRVGMPTGIKTTLRNKRMLCFIDKLIHVALPRIRDFRGISRKSFDGNGNYSIGLQEITAFPEIRIDDVSKLHGVQINIITSTDDDAQALTLLESLGLPFKK